MKSSQAANSGLPSPALSWEGWTDRAFVAPLPQSNPGLPGFWSVKIVPEAGKPAAGRRVGGWGSELRRELRSASL